jgi:Holliday junction resolvase RusA-like endonuclease
MSITIEEVERDVAVVLARHGMTKAQFFDDGSANELFETELRDLWLMTENFYNGFRRGEPEVNEMFPTIPTEHDVFSYEVFVPWDKPQVKERPRFANGRVYTPKKTLDAEKLIAEHWREYGLPKVDQPCEVELEFSNDGINVLIASCPDYVNRKLRGDLDNYVKIVLDALNDVAYTDDKHVVHIEARKL